MVLCRCVSCERIRLGNNSYHPRFFLRHHEFIETTLTVDENSPTSMEMCFSIYGDPIPTGINHGNELFYTEFEVNLLIYTITDLIVGHIFVPFSASDTIQLEVFFLSRSSRH